MMITFVKTVSASLDSIARRVVKFTRLSISDVQTGFQVGPAGMDSNPRKNLVAIYSPSMASGRPVILGYVNRNQLADTGETRLFSEDADGALKTYVWLKKTGTIEIAGSADNAVAFEDLKQAMDQLAMDINTELTKVQVAITALGGAYAMLPITIDISAAKINEIKTP